MKSIARANRTILESDGRRMLLLKWALCAALLSDMALCPKLWLTVRPFPTLTVVPGLPELPQGLSVFLTCVLVVGVILIGFMPRPRLAILGTALVAAILVIFDMSRLQPWFYQYLTKLLAIAAVDWDEPVGRRYRAAWGACALMVIGVYFWSGLQKLNGSFTHDIFPWLLRPVLGDEMAARLQPYALFAPLFETSMGLLLLAPKTRLTGLIGASAMHGFLLVTLGPLGRSFNSTVWPWNFWIAVMGWILFFRNRERIFPGVWTAPVGKAVVALIGFLPALNFVDRWDGFLSASYYSGRLQDGWVLFNERGYQALPAEYREGNGALKQTAKDRYLLDVTQWALDQLNVPPYAEARYYSQVMSKLQKAGVPADSMALYVRDRPRFNSTERTYKLIERPNWTR